MRKLLHFEISENRVFGLDVLRFVAILMVLVGHSLILIPEKIEKSVYPYLYDGVSMFFVLSGFLIGGILIKTLNKENVAFSDLLNFWKRRWLRTLPVYFVALTFLLIYTLFFFPINFPPDWYRFLFFTQNLFGHYRPDFFSEAWSLSIEEWFYLIVPVIIFAFIIFRKSSVKWTLIGLSMGMIILITFYRYHLYQSYNLPENPNEAELKLYKNFLDLGINYQVIPRLDSIMYGVLAACISFYYPKTWNFRWNFILFFIGLFLLYYVKYYGGQMVGSFYVFHFWSPSLKSIGVFLLLPFLSNMKNGFGKWTVWISFFSIISYSMYLVNLNIVAVSIINQVMLGNYSQDNFRVGSNWQLYYALFWFLTIVISYLLYQLIEVPFMKMRDKKT